MMSILDYFDLNLSATVQRPTITNDGTGRPVETLSDVGDFECLFWEGGTSESLKSDRFREEVSASLAFHPGTDIQPKDKITVDGAEYQVLGVDDIGRRRKVLIVFVKEFT